MDVDLDQLRELMKALNEYELDELEVHQGEESILIRRNKGHLVAGAPMMAAPMAVAPAAAAAPVEEVVPEGELITSPFVGTFYRAPNPESDPFISASKPFTKGQTLCIVEAMKLMNEIEAEFEGVCLEVLVENGTPVEYGDPLFRVEKK